MASGQFYGGVVGYEPVNISFTGNHWGGLEYNNQLCLLDGSVGDGSDERWWYAMGSFGDFDGGIPGSTYPVHQVTTHDNTQIADSQVELYVWDEEVFRLGQIFQSGMVLQVIKRPIHYWYRPDKRTWCGVTMLFRRSPLSVLPHCSKMGYLLLQWMWKSLLMDPGHFNCLLKKLAQATCCLFRAENRI